MRRSCWPDTSTASPTPAFPRKKPSADGEGDARGLVGRRPAGRALTSRTSSSTGCCAPASSSSTTRSTQGTAGCWPRRRRTCPSSCQGGRTPRLATSMRATSSAANVKNVHTVRTGIEYMVELAPLVSGNVPDPFHRVLPDRRRHRRGFPHLRRAHAATRTCRFTRSRCWGYFCQISDSTTSYGSYSGAVPNEKITWGKLAAATPKFIIESDATIVAPLIFACVLDQ